MYHVLGNKPDLKNNNSKGVAVVSVLFFLLFPLILTYEQVKSRCRTKCFTRAPRHVCWLIGYQSRLYPVLFVVLTLYKSILGIPICGDHSHLHDRTHQLIVWDFTRGNQINPIVCTWPQFATLTLSCTPFHWHKHNRFVQGPFLATGSGGTSLSWWQERIHNLQDAH